MATILASRPGRVPRLAAHADELFARVSHYAGSGLRNHCLRVEELTARLLASSGIAVAVERSLLHAIALVHDLGLLAPEVDGANYLQRSRVLFEREFSSASYAFTPHERLVVAECLLYNHRLLPVPGLTPEAEAFRAAVWIEHTHGVMSYGLSSMELRDVFATYPRDNFNWVLLDFARRVLVHEPWTIINGIFF